MRELTPAEVGVSVMAVIALVFVAGLFLLRCTPLEQQRQACFAKIRPQEQAAIRQRCVGYTWDTCPEKEQIIAEFRAKRERCP
jgi:hypothetical protein